MIPVTMYGSELVAELKMLKVWERAGWTVLGMSSSEKQLRLSSLKTKLEAEMV